MAISTYRVYLMRENSSQWEKLVDIKNYPDLLGTPEKIETTTLSDAQETFINGIKRGGEVQFTANYDVTTFETLRALENKEGKYAVWFGATGVEGAEEPKGQYGKFTFPGKISLGISGKGVNEVVEMTITIARTGAVTFDKGSEN